LDKIKYIVETKDHECVDSKIPKLFSKVCAFYEEGHVIMDCLFVHFHIKASIVKHVAITLIDQSQEHELGILMVWNKLKSMKLGGQLGPQSQQIHPSIQFSSIVPKVYSHHHFAP
jgi:hypothetical protein